MADAGKKSVKKVRVLGLEMTVVELAFAVIIALLAIGFVYTSIKIGIAGQELEQAIQEVRELRSDSSPTNE
jgi:hypothetical protein